MSTQEFTAARNQAFWKMCERLGLEDHELDLACNIWEYAERTMQGKSLQTTPAILKPAAIKARKNGKNILPAVLSQADTQFLVSVLRDLLKDCSEAKAQVRVYAKQVFSYCDPADPETKDDFETLNKLRDAERDMTDLYKRLSRVQSQMKKMRKLG